MKGKPVNMLSKLLNAIVGPQSFKLTSGYIAPNHKRKRRGRYKTSKNTDGGQGKQGMRAYDGTMDGPFRSTRGRNV